MREARSYSIVDHRLLHGGYLGRLSHTALALYLFLVVVGDREGRSFYSDASAGAILRLSGPALADARQELIASALIRYRRPYWWVESLTHARSLVSAPRPCVSVPVSHREDLPADRQSRLPCQAPMPIRGIVPKALRDIIRSLEEKP